MADAERVALAQRVQKATARLSIEVIATPTLTQCAKTAITAMHAASTMFTMGAMLGRLVAQLKMPRPDAYAVRAGLHVDVKHGLEQARPADAARPALGGGLGFSLTLGSDGRRCAWRIWRRLLDDREVPYYEHREAA